MPRFRIPGSRYPATLTGLLALFAFFGGSLEAQTQTNEKIPAGTQNQTAFQLRVASNLVVVRVVVRDAQGKPIEGLRKEDFHLFDRGKEQTITQFEVGTSATQSANPSSAVATGQSLAAVVPTAATPLRFLALYFDDLHMSDTDLNTGTRSGRSLPGSQPSAGRPGWHIYLRRYVVGLYLGLQNDS